VGTHHFVAEAGTQHFVAGQISGWKARATGEGATAWWGTQRVRGTHPFGWSGTSRLGTFA